MIKRGLVFFLSLLAFNLSYAEALRVAVASNFVQPAKVLADQFAQQHGIRMDIISGSSGKLLAQIQHGAPFDIFLSADQQKPAALIASGHGLADSRFTYARGQLVLWSLSDAADVKARLMAGNFRHLALANPRLAPYGQAAAETLAALGISESTQDKWVMGENIAQTWHFVQSGNAELGFVAQSQVMVDGEVRQGSVWRVPDSLHKPVLQDAVLLSRAKDNAAAQQFMRFLRSAQAQKVITAYGYGQPL